MRAGRVMMLKLAEAYPTSVDGRYRGITPNSRRNRLSHRLLCHNLTQLTTQIRLFYGLLLVMHLRFNWIRRACVAAPSIPIAPKTIPHIYYQFVTWQAASKYKTKKNKEQRRLFATLFYCFGEKWFLWLFSGLAVPICINKWPFVRSCYLSWVHTQLTRLIDFVC